MNSILVLASTCAMAVVATSNWRCGSTWADANSRCGTACPTGLDSECFDRELCFSDLVECDTFLSNTTSNLRCGTTWEDANNRCGTTCASGTDSECKDGEFCFGDLTQLC